MLRTLRFGRVEYKEETHGRAPRDQVWLSRSLTLSALKGGGGGTGLVPHGIIEGKDCSFY